MADALTNLISSMDQTRPALVCLGKSGKVVKPGSRAARTFHVLVVRKGVPYIGKDLGGVHAVMNRLSRLARMAGDVACWDADLFCAQGVTRHTASYTAI